MSASDVSAEPRLTVALTFDHDAISSEVQRGDGPVSISRGEFGPRVGVPRILALLERNGIAATFFVPGHTLATFPESVAAIVAAGHELGCHGWAHEDLATLTKVAERDVMKRSFAAFVTILSADILYRRSRARISAFVAGTAPVL